MLALIRSCNRSVPCMDVVSYAVQVLLNVAKVGFCPGRGTFRVRKARSAARASVAHPWNSGPKLKFLHVQEPRGQRCRICQHGAEETLVSDGFIPSVFVVLLTVISGTA